MLHAPKESLLPVIKVGLVAKVIEVNRMHRTGWVLQAIINITEDGPLLLTPKARV
jgi:hypothetical protein